MSVYSICPPILTWAFVLRTRLSFWLHCKIPVVDDVLYPPLATSLMAPDRIVAVPDFHWTVTGASGINKTCNTRILNPPVPVMTVLSPIGDVDAIEIGANTLTPVTGILETNATSFCVGLSHNLGTLRLLLGAHLSTVVGTRISWTFCAISSWVLVDHALGTLRLCSHIHCGKAPGTGRMSDTVCVMSSCVAFIHSCGTCRL